MSIENGVFTRMQAEESAMSIIGSNLRFYSKIEKYVNKCSMNNDLCEVVFREIFCFVIERHLSKSPCPRNTAYW